MRLLRRIDKDALNKSFRCCCHMILTDINKKVTISMDGKTIKISANMQSYERSLHIISTVIAEYGITIGQLSVESMHWLLYVNLEEDNCSITDENIKTILNIIRKIILNTLKTYKDTTNSKGALSKITRKCLFNTE